MAQGGLFSPVYFCLYFNDITSPSLHFELAVYRDDTAIIATHRKPMLRVSYIHQRPIAVAERRGDRHQLLKELCDNLCDGPTAFPLVPTSTNFRVANPVGRHIALSGGEPRYMAELLTSYRSD
jgi:hypothetical protein